MIPLRTSLNKSKKRQAIASAACEALGSCWLAAGSSGRALGALGRCWESLGGSFFHKINPRRALVTGKPCF